MNLLLEYKYFIEEYYNYNYTIYKKQYIFNFYFKQKTE